MLAAPANRWLARPAAARLAARVAAALAAVAAVAALLTLAGCVQPSDDPSAAVGPVPVDFTLDVHVQAPVGQRDPAAMPCRYVLAPDRKLRAAFGPGATPDYFPHVARILTPRQVEALYHFVDASHLAAEPTSPAAEVVVARGDHLALLYRVSITAAGRTQHFATTPAESPATVQLVRRLAALAGVQSPTNARNIRTTSPPARDTVTEPKP